MIANESWTFETTMDNIAKVFEAVGVVIIIIGGIYALLPPGGFVRTYAGSTPGTPAMRARPLSSAGRTRAVSR